MHTDELAINADLVRRLLAAQFPHWAELPLERVPSAGTDNAIFRLGDELALRLPRIHWAARQPQRERELLPLLAPHLPLPVPVPIATGEPWLEASPAEPATPGRTTVAPFAPPGLEAPPAEPATPGRTTVAPFAPPGLEAPPGEGYPWHWSVVPWLEGENATLERLADPVAEAVRLAEFVVRLRAIDTAGRPVSGRGRPLAAVDAETRAALGKVGDTIDAAAATAAWERALATPTWDGPPVWSHGDLMSENLLAIDGRVTAVIDFGAISVGDPACDLIVAWKLLPAGAPREAFRRAVAVDEATWARGRGWALATGLWALPYYVDTNSVLYGIAHRSIDEVLAERS